MQLQMIYSKKSGQGWSSFFFLQNFPAVAYSSTSEHSIFQTNWPEKRSTAWKLCDVGFTKSPHEHPIILNLNRIKMYNNLKTNQSLESLQPALAVHRHSGSLN